MIGQTVNKKTSARPGARPTPTGSTNRTSASRSDRPRIPGPLLDATVGDTLVVHFRNAVPLPVTMHPHGVFYSNEMDGAYKGYWTDPGGFVQKGRTFTYVWECPEGTQGTWMYHDHGPFEADRHLQGSVRTD